MDDNRRRAVIAAVVLLAALLAGCEGGASPDEAQALAAEARSAHGDVERGREIFTQESRPTCASCHGLADAGTRAGRGPDLDALDPDVERVLQALVGGPARMPSYAGHLDAQQMADVAAYVAEVSAAR
jgi:mono/diheme cytochrome c family protein